MDNKQFVIFQGSTQTLELCMPYNAPTGMVASVTIVQGEDPVLEYGMGLTPTPAIAGAGTLTLDADDKSVLRLSMTQADTLRLTPGDAEIQLRVRSTSGAETFEPLVGVIGRAYKTGVI